MENPLKKPPSIKRGEEYREEINNKLMKGMKQFLGRELVFDGKKENLQGFSGTITEVNGDKQYISVQLSKELKPGLNEITLYLNFDFTKEDLEGWLT